MGMETKFDPEVEMYLRYLGVLKLLEECSPHVDEELREQIQTAMVHACEHHPLTTRRVMNRVIIEVT